MGIEKPGLAKVTLKVFNNESTMALLGVSERTFRKYREEGHPQIPYEQRQRY